MAKVTQRNGHLVMDFNFMHTRCRETTILEDTTSNRKRAQAILNKIILEIKNGDFNYKDYFPKSKMAVKLENKINPIINCQKNEKKLFINFTNTWLQEMKPGWKNSYYDQVVRNLHLYIYPEFSNKNIDQFSKSDVLMLRASLAEKLLAPSTINKIITLFKSIIEQACDRYDIEYKQLNIKPLKGIRPDIQPLSLSEVNDFINLVREDLKAYFIIRFFTGMRSGEIHALQYKHIDLINRKINIEQSMGGYGLTTPKNELAYRSISMSDTVYDAFKYHFDAQSNQHKNENTYIFSSNSDQRFLNNEINDKVWKPTLRCLGLKVRRIYQTRHTAASLWLASGESPEWIARQLGHSNTEMLFRNYSRYIPNAIRTDGEQFNKLITTNINSNIGRNNK